ncbi:MAG: Bcr/CflA family efflux MFS transporter [Prevotellaceae bacterium]|nr:Bcr/CflA family efflux MFS transporter [Prevotellaceae bacterium]
MIGRLRAARTVHLHRSEGSTVTTGMVGLAGGQIIIGPLSDKYGRKRLLVGSMLLFALASLACILAPTITFFNCMRVLQGVAGAGGVVLSKSMATDMFEGKQLTNFLAILAAITGIAPVFAPVIGGVLSSFTNWQGLFCVLLALGIYLMVSSMRLKESLPKEKRTQQSLTQAFINLFRVFRNKRFTLSTLAIMFCFLCFFAYISSSPFIFQNIYGLNGLEYGLCFGMNSIFIGIGTVIATRFHHANTALKWASIDLMISAILVALCQVFEAPLAMLMPCYIYMMLSFGMMQPVSTAIAMDSERDNAGAASAIFGAATFVAGAIASPLVTVGRILISSSIVVIIGAILCLALTLPLAEAVKEEQMKK